jgi:hypothetical protein
MAEAVAPELKPEQIAVLLQAMEDPLQKITDYQEMYLTTEFPENDEPFDTEVEPPRPHKGQPTTYLQVFTSRQPLPNGKGGMLPVEELPNQLDSKPSDQRFSPADLRWVFGKMPFAFEVHSKERDGRAFFAVIFKLRIDGFLYSYTRNVLPTGIPDPEPGPEPKWQYVNEKPSWLPDPCD